MRSLKDKMYDYEVTPPADVWDKISIDLDESELSNKFPGKLYTAEATPPPAVWEKIDSALNPVPEPVAKPITRRIPVFVRYAAAAMLIGIVGFAVIRMTGGNNNSLQAEATNTDTAKPRNENSILPQKTVVTPIAAENQDDDALEQSKTLVAKLDVTARRTRKLNAFPVNAEFMTADFADKELSQTIYAYEDHVPAIAERYVMLMTPDGNIIRMSKKWGDLLCCVSGEEQDAGCKDQLKKWQEKIAASPLAPSPGNFMDILGLVNSLNDGPDL